MTKTLLVLTLTPIMISCGVGSYAHEKGQQESALTTGNKTRDESGRPLLSVVTPRIRDEVSKQREGLNPLNDGWPTEAFVSRAESNLKRIVTQMLIGDRVQTEQLKTLVSSDFACASLRPEKLIKTFGDETISVLRADPTSLAGARPSNRGLPGLSQAMQALRGPLQMEKTHHEVRVDVKIHGLTSSGNAAATKALVQLSNVASRSAQINSTWDCLWENWQKEPRLSAIRVGDYEEIASETGHAAWFTDCTESVLGANRSFHDQLVYGLDHWLKRLERGHRIHVFAASGLAVGDANGDGLDDLFVCQPGGLPNRLFVQNVDGSATDHSMRARVDYFDSTSSALFLDLDNDDDQDLVMATLSGVLVLENDSTGRFKLRGALPTGGADMQSLSAADYDNDGDLDIYVCLNFPKVTAETLKQPDRFVYHDANDGAANHLFRNDILPGEKWVFADVTAAAGLDQDNRRHSLAAAWEDYDNDGDQDLYVANDYGRNCLYRNDDGKFQNLADQARVTDYGSGMSVGWADFNLDGKIDLYVGNMFSSAGSRITSQSQFRPDANARTRNILRRFAKGNSLFANLGNGEFREVGGLASVEIGRWAWSSIFIDANNSGWEDLLVANGYMTVEPTTDL